MPVTDLTDTLGDVPAGTAVLITHAAWEDLKDALRASKPIAGPGLLQRLTDDGILLTLAPTAAVASCPWDGEMGEDEDGLFFKFTQPGALIPAGMPSNMFGVGGLFSADASVDPTFIKLSVTTDGNVPTGCEIVASGSPAAPIGIAEGTAPASFEVDLWAISAGDAKRIAPCGVLQAVAVVALESDVEDPVCGGDNLIRWYTWVINPVFSGG